MSTEVFTEAQVLVVLKQWLDFGEQSLDETGLEAGKGHKGYFAGPGFAARCLQYHILTRSAETSIAYMESPEVTALKLEVQRLQNVNAGLRSEIRFPRNNENYT